MQFVCYTTVAVSTLIFVVDCSNLFSGIGILISCALSFAMIVVCRAGQLSDFQNKRQRVSLPQFLDHHYFFFWCRSLSKTKACNFFRYSFSALSR